MNHEWLTYFRPLGSKTNDLPLGFHRFPHAIVIEIELARYTILVWMTGVTGRLARRMEIGGWIVVMLPQIGK